MKRLLTFFSAWALALCSWAQSAQDFAARFMESCSDNEEVKCVTVGPKMLSTLAGIDDTGSRKGLKEWTDGVKSIRIITSETDSEELRKDAVTMLKANRKRYSLYRPKDNTDYGDCLWVRKVKDKIVELVYVAPHSEKTFMVMNFTGKISDGFVERIIKPEESREQKKTTN